MAVWGYVCLCDLPVLPLLRAKKLMAFVFMCVSSKHWLVSNEEEADGAELLSKIPLPDSDAPEGILPYVCFFSFSFAFTVFFTRWVS